MQRDEHAAECLAHKEKVEDEAKMAKAKTEGEVLRFEKEAQISREKVEAEAMTVKKKAAADITRLEKEAETERE